MKCYRTAHCPVCGDKLDRRNQMKVAEHLEKCGATGMFRAAYADHACLCGWNQWKTVQEFNLHVLCDPHDWQKLLTTKAMESM